MVKKTYSVHKYGFVHLSENGTKTIVKTATKKLSRENLKNLTDKVSADVGEKVYSVYLGSNRVTYGMPDEQFLQQASVIEGPDTTNDQQEDK